MSRREVFTNHRVFKFNIGCIANLIWITQITCKRVNNALLIYNWRLDFSGLKTVLFQFSADKYRLQCSTNLVTEVTHLPFTALADVWSLEGKVSCTMLLSFLFFSRLPNEKLWMALVMVELIKSSKDRT